MKAFDECVRKKYNNAKTRAETVHLIDLFLCFLSDSGSDQRVMVERSTVQDTRRYESPVCDHAHAHKKKKKLLFRF